MLDVTVKTLDGKNRSFSVPDDITVKEFKEKITSSINISPENQRLIFIGRVLQDDKKLNDYDVNGKTLHVVERPPPNARNDATTSAASSSSPGGAQAATHPGAGAHNFVLGSIQIPGGNPANVQNIVQQALTGIGGNPTVSSRTSADGSSTSVHINLGHVQMPQLQSESQRRIDVARKMINQVNNIINRIENPNPTTQQSTNSNADNSATNASTQSSDNSSHTHLFEDLEDEHEMHDVEAISIVTETVEAEIEMETDEASGTSSVSSIRIPQGAQSTVETVEIGRGSNNSQTHSNVAGGPNVRIQTGVPNNIHGQADNSGSNPQTSRPANNPPTASPGTQATTTPQHPRTVAYADLLGELFQVNQRLQPHLERYRNLLAEDFNVQTGEYGSVQRFYNLVSQALHSVSHAYHSLSDLMCDVHSPAPRTLRATPAHPHPMVHQIPVQRSVSIQQVPVPGTNTTAAAPRSTASSSTTTSSSASAHSTSGAVPSANTTQRTTGTAAGSSSNPLSSVTGGLPMPIPGMMPGMMPPLPGMMPGMMASGAGGGQPGSFAAGTGRPPFIPPDVFENIIRMATSAATNAVQQQLTTGSAPHPHMVMVTQPSSGNPAVSVSSTRAGTQPVNPGGPRPTPAGTVPPAQAPSARTAPPAQPRVNIRPSVQIQTAPGQPPMPVLPGIVPNALIGINTVDPYLHCQSRHFMTRRVANLARNGPHNTNGNSNIADTVSSIVNDMGLSTTQASNTGTTASSQASQGPVVNPFAALFGGNVRAAAPGSAGATQQPGAPFMQQLRSILQQGQNAAGNPSSDSHSGSGRPVTDNMFAELVSGIGQYVGQANAGNQPNGTIADFLNSLGEGYNAPLGESLITDIFHTVSSSINLVDLMQLFSGISNSLQRTRAPLQNYIRTTLLQDQDPTPDNIEQCIDRVMQDAAPIIEQACSGLETRDDIDIEATYNTFLENNLLNLANFIMNSRDGDVTFHEGLYSRVRRLLHEAIILGETCLQGGFSDVTNIVHTRVGSMASDVNPLIRQWMSDVTVQQLQTMRPTITVTAADVQPYVVKHSHTNMDVHTDTHSHSSDNDNFMSADEDTPEDTEKKQVKKEMASEKKSLSSEVGGGVTRPKVPVVRGENDVIRPRNAPHGGEHRPRQTEGAPLLSETGEVLCVPSTQSSAHGRPQMTPLAYHTVRCAAVPTDNTTAPHTTPQDWHTILPQDWVPVIAKDIERQKTPENQKPLSDAYIAGNPAKKRKLSGYDQTETEQLVLPEQSVPHSIQMSAAAVGAEPLTSLHSLCPDIHHNTQLQHAFHQEVRNEVRKNLRDDKDLVPYKYKNTEKYFGNKK